MVNEGIIPNKYRLIASLLYAAWAPLSGQWFLQAFFSVMSVLNLWWYVECKIAAAPAKATKEE